MSGATQLEADAYVPPGHSLKSIEFSWNDQPVGIATKPPYRIDFNAPDTFGYIRAVGTLDDDRTAEDTHIVNAAGFGEAVDVHTLVFPSTVLDRSGARVNGLRSEDFSATDNREKLALNVHDLPDEPATIGLVVDLSASMSTVLLPVMDIGTRIVKSMAGGRDKMFLASFADEPRMMQPVSGSRAPLETKLLDAHAYGNTALVDALAFSMQQFTGATGKRAVIFITDGNENASEQTTQACLEMSRAAGVPMYFIVPADSVDTDAGREFRRVMRKMAETTGGAIFNRPKREELDAIVARIRDEVRGQYLLSFAAKQTGGDWRTLHVSVPGKAATVRTVSGYYAR
jgi:VWFA-related protein